MVISMDGSASHGQAGWGFVVFCASWPFSVDACGPVCIRPQHDLHIGAARATNNTGELSAVYWALVWLLRVACTLDLCQQQVLLQFDSEYAHHLSVGAWKPTSNCGLVLAVREQLALASEVFSIAWEHVDAHTGDILNERADKLAKHGASGHLFCNFPSSFDALFGSAPPGVAPSLCALR